MKCFLPLPCFPALLLLPMLLLTSPCGPWLASCGVALAADKAEITVSAASLTNALTRLARQFEALAPQYIALSKHGALVDDVTILSLQLLLQNETNPFLNISRRSVFKYL